MYAPITSVKLGKVAVRKDRRTLKLAAYRAAAPLTTPDAFDLTPAVHRPGFLQWTWPMLANDRYGDCTCAAAAHMIECWSANAGTEFCPSEDQTLALYAAVSMFNPLTGQNDNGAVELDVLNYWRKTGIAGHQISAYAQLDPKSPIELREAVYLFGGAYLGLALPLSAQQQDVWDVPATGIEFGDGTWGSWGGHAVNVVAYDANGITIITWGQTKRMTWAFYQAYCDEAYAVLSPDWFNVQGLAPNGFDLTALQNDLNEITNAA